MTVNVRKTRIVVPESVAMEWLNSMTPEALKNQNVDGAQILVFEDGTSPDDILRLMGEEPA